jgi:hypothetical protein
MRPRRWAIQGIVLGLLVTSFTLAACTGAAAPAVGSSGTQGQGSGSAGATSAATSAGGQGGGAVTLPDPCALLTPDEIKAQFTFAVAPGIASGPLAGATSPECDWNSVDYHPSFTGVQLIVQKFEQGFFDFMKGPNHKDVAGLGDAAYFLQPTNPFTIEMKKGNLHFSLTVLAGGTADSPETQQQRVVTLANNVLAHL